MKKFTKVLSLVLAMALLLCVPVGVSADEVDTATINPDALGIWMYKLGLNATLSAMRCW